MPTSVPAAYRGWVNTAAKGTGLPPALVAAQINMESGFNPKAVSSAGAQGIAQFIPSTWASNAPRGSSPFDPNASLQAYTKLMGTLVRQYGGNVKNALAAYNAGPGNLGAGMGYANSILSAAGGGVNVKASPPASAASAGSAGDLSASFAGPNIQFDQAAFQRAQQAAIAGKYISQSNQDLWNLGPKSSPITGPDLFAKGLLTTTMPNQADYQTTSAAQTALQHLAGTTDLTTHPGALPAGQGNVNPLAHGWTLERTDQGVDARAAPGTPILAPNDVVVKEVVPNWYAGQPLVLMQLTGGPDRGKYIYAAEQITQVPKVGQRIPRGQVVARYASSGSGIEIGWGDPRSSGRTLAQATPGYSGDTSPQALAAGSSFRKTFLGG